MTKLTTSADEGLVELLVHLDGFDNSVFEDCLLLLQGLLSSFNLLLATLDLDLDQTIFRIAAAGDINLSSGCLTKLVQNSTT